MIEQDVKSGIKLNKGLYRQSPIFSLLTKNFLLIVLCKYTYKPKPYTLVGPTVTRPVQDPLAVQTSTTDYISSEYY